MLMCAASSSTRLGNGFVAAPATKDRLTACLSRESTMELRLAPAAMSL